MTATPLSVGVLGATGRVGKLLVQVCLEDDSLILGAAVTRPESTLIGQDAATSVGLPPCGVLITALGTGCFEHCDVVIDFSLPDGLDSAFDVLDGKPLVTGTTGLRAETINKLNAYTYEAPVLAAANFSTGVNVLLTLVEIASKALPSAEIEIVETHHRYKKDAPSGTALALGQAAAEARGTTLDQVVQHGADEHSTGRNPETIVMHAIRMGHVVGEHTVHFGESGETLKLAHSATARSTFAEGAVRAAKWLTKQAPGQYTMAEMLGLVPIE